jgi:HK97 family phage portal protein
VRSLASLPRAARRALENRSPVPLSPRSGNSWLVPRHAGSDFTAQMEAYSQDGTLFPIVNRLANATAGQDWRLWKKAASGLKEDRTPVTSHAVLDLLENPNPFMSRMELMEAGQQHNDLTGETNIVVGFQPGIRYPLDLYPVRPDRLLPQPDPYEFLKGWMYRGPENQKVPLELRELLRFIQPSPLDPYRGMGPVQALLKDIDAQRYGKEWQAAFFANSARPGGVIEIDRRLGDEEFDEMRDRWNEQHRGISKAHRVAIIEHGAKWVETSYSMRDLQFAEMDTVSRDKMLVAYGFPKSMLGIVEDVNRANAEAGEYMFARWLTTPRLERWKGMLNRKLLPLFGDTLNRTHELDYESPVPENGEQAMTELETKSAAVVALVREGFDSAEVLDMVGWPQLTYTAPPPPTVVAPPQRDGSDEQPDDSVDAAWDSVDAAMRWKVQAKSDNNICEPCQKNDGKTYRNRADAYADYPGGKGYIKCVGAQYGNDCRCTVVKRRSK